MEELQCLLDTPHLRVSYDKANSWLYNQWLGTHDLDSLRQGTEAVHKCLLAQPCTKVLSDHSGLTGSWEGVSPWIATQYFEQLAARGVAYLAWVYSARYADCPAMERTLGFMMQPVVAIFNDVASAYDWLRQCPASRPEAC